MSRLHASLLAFGICGTLLAAGTVRAQTDAITDEPAAAAEPAAPVESAEPDAGDGRPVFLVTDVVVGPGVGIDKEAARDVLALRFGRLKDKIEVRSLAEVKTTLDNVALAQLLGSASGDDDLARLEGYIDVDRLVFGRVQKIAGITEVQVRVYNSKDGVTEVAFSRRLGVNAPAPLVLTLLDSLADQLVVWTLDTYGDGAPSERFAALKNKKLAPADAEDADAEAGGRARRIGKRPDVDTAPGQWGLLGVGYAFADGDASIVDIALIAGGGMALLLGGTAVGLDYAD